MAHTQGPWFVHRKPGFSRLFIGSDSYDVAELCHAGFESAEYSNAALIAAAPELLAALKRLLSLMPGQVWNEMAVHATGGPDEVNQAADMAAAAISKAEGRAT